MGRKGGWVPPKYSVLSENVSYGIFFIFDIFFSFGHIESSCEETPDNLIKLVQM